MQRNHRTPEGIELGEGLARFCDEAEPKARLHAPTMPPRCNSCAFRHGKHVANGSPWTLLIALRCIMDDDVFECHEPARANQPCSGWLTLWLTK